MHEQYFDYYTGPRSKSHRHLWMLKHFYFDSSLRLLDFLCRVHVVSICMTKCSCCCCKRFSLQPSTISQHILCIINWCLTVVMYDPSIERTNNVAQQPCRSSAAARAPPIFYCMAYIYEYAYKYMYSVLYVYVMVERADVFQEEM